MKTLRRFFTSKVHSLLIATLCGCALALASCADFQTSGSTPVTATGQDLQGAVALATQDYIDYKGGKADFAWSVKKGLEAYQLALKTAGDVKLIVKQWSDGSKAGQSYAQRLADLFAGATGTPEAKAKTLAQGVELTAAANHGP